MKIIFVFLLSYLFQNILTNEIENSSQIIDNKRLFNESKIYVLDDASFDEVINEGKKYRWLILFYSYTNNEYINAIKELNNIFNSYKSINEMRFAQMNIDNNIMTKIRLNINKYPYIILLENETFIEMNSTINHENLADFIFIIFSEYKNNLKPIPKKLKYYYVKYYIFKRYLDDNINQLNQILLERGIKIKFNIYKLIASLIIFIILFYLFVKFLFKYCCCYEEDISEELKQLGEEFNKKKSEIFSEEKKMNEEEEEDITENDEEEEEDEDEINRRRLQEERKKILEDIRKRRHKRVKGNIKYLNKRKKID
jgi:hypothetical protein